MPGMLVLAVGMGRMFGETDKAGDNVWAIPIMAAGAPSSTSLSFCRKIWCLDMAHALAQAWYCLSRCRPHLGQCPCLVGTWLHSAGSLLFPRHSYAKFKPSFPWDPCLSAKPGVMAAPQLHPQGATSLCPTPRPPLAAPGVASRASWARQDTALTRGDRASGGGCGAAGARPAGAVLSLCICHLCRPRGTELSKVTVSSSAGKPGCLRRAALPDTHPSLNRGCRQFIWAQS